MAFRDLNLAVLDTAIHKALSQRERGRPLGSKDTKNRALELITDDGTDVYASLSLAQDMIRRAVDRDTLGKYIPPKMRQILHTLDKVLDYELEHVDQCIDDNREQRRKNRSAQGIIEDYWKEIEAKSKKEVICSVWK
jgi:hypothetical protein